MSDTYVPSKALRIKHHVRDGLKAATTAAGQRVYVQRTLPASLDDLPCILIFDGGEDVVDDALIGQPRAYGCDMVLFVVALAEAGGEDQEIVLDQLVQAIKREMQADETRGGAARRSLYVRRDPLAADEQGPLPFASEVLVYAINFYEPDIPGE
jgi:hypothetical protein